MSKWDTLYATLAEQEISPSQICELEALMRDVSKKGLQGTPVSYDDFCERFKAIVPVTKGDYMKVAAFIVANGSKAGWYPEVGEQFRNDQDARIIGKLHNLLDD